MEDTDEYLKCMATKMWPKFQTYWSDFSIILAIACILDPRYKMTFVEFCYKKAYGEDCLEILVLRNKLQALFDEYNKLKPSQSTSLLTSKKGNESGTQPTEDMDVELDLFKEFDNLTNDEFSIGGHKSQLEHYLDEPKMTRNAKFDVLDFWKVNQFRYPELAAMARDVLSIPVSTVASESAFSVGGRVLDQYCSTLKPEIVEAIICSKDWLYGNKAKKDEMTILMDKISEDVIELDLNANDES